ncbi:MAG: hypothetical protein LUG21_04135, partial [Clostridiales bacterium]|nr:hypothetical protein [Clostridiales bacterium]
MKLIKMKYKDFEFVKNPQSIEVKKSKNINEKALFGVGSAVEEVSKNAAVIKANGVYFGENSLEFMFDLQRTFDEKGAGILILPCGECYCAFFKS